MLTIKELRRRIIGRATVDQEFRTSLVSAPKRAIEQELDLSIPASHSIEVHEDSRTTANLVLPPASHLGDTELEAVIIGGLSVNGERVNFSPGRAQTFIDWLKDIMRDW